MRRAVSLGNARMTYAVCLAMLSSINQRSIMYVAMALTFSHVAFLLFFSF